MEKQGITGKKLIISFAGPRLAPTVATFLSGYVFHRLRAASPGNSCPSSHRCGVFSRRAERRGRRFPWRILSTPARGQITSPPPFVTVLRFSMTKQHLDLSPQGLLLSSNMNETLCVSFSEEASVLPFRPVLCKACESTD